MEQVADMVGRRYFLWPGSLRVYVAKSRCRGVRARMTPYFTNRMAHMCEHVVPRDLGADSFFFYWAEVLLVQLPLSAKCFDCRGRDNVRTARYRVDPPDEKLGAFSPSPTARVGMTASPPTEWSQVSFTINHRGIHSTLSSKVRSRGEDQRKTLTLRTITYVLLFSCFRICCPHRCCDRFRFGLCNVTVWVPDPSYRSKTCRKTACPQNRRAVV